jgi:hypothetical protein
MKLVFKPSKLLFKRSCVVKFSTYEIGYEGENYLTNKIAKVCKKWEIRDMSSHPAESDIHILNNKGEIIAFECKNKQLIKYTDVQKSIRDISFLKEKYGNQFIGYMFVSLKSYNIPHRDLFHLIHGVPTLWYGMDDDTNDEILEKMIQIIINLSADTNKSDIQSNDFIENINNISSIIDSNRTNIKNINKNISVMYKNIKKLEDNNEILYKVIEEITNI